MRPIRILIIGGLTVASLAMLSLSTQEHDFDLVILDSLSDVHYSSPGVTSIGEIVSDHLKSSKDLSLVSDLVVIDRAVYPEPRFSPEKVLYLVEVEERCRGPDDYG